MTIKRWLLIKPINEKNHWLCVDHKLWQNIHFFKHFQFLAPGSSNDNWQIQKNFIRAIIEGDRNTEGLTIAPDQTRVGMVTFGNNGRLHWGLDEHTVSNHRINVYRNF